MLLQTIDELRAELNQIIMANDFDLSNEAVQIKSREVDQLIALYYNKNDNSVS